MTPRFDADWDRFESVEHYEREAERWFMEVMRCLRPDGSAFICGSFHNIGLINRICQVHDFVIINEIIWAVRNSRPNASTMRLQASHHNVLWIAKEFGRYRYNYRACKQADYAGDYFSGRGRQMRSVWDILAAPQENKLYGHPSPKPVALFDTDARCRRSTGRFVARSVFRQRLGYHRGDALGDVIYQHRA